MKSFAENLMLLLQGKQAAELAVGNSNKVEIAISLIKSYPVRLVEERKQI